MAQGLANLLPDPATLGSIPSIPKTISVGKNLLMFAEVNQQRYLEESKQGLEKC